MKRNIGKMLSAMLSATVAALTLGGLFGSLPAQADASAVAFLKPYAAWAKSRSDGFGFYGLKVTMVSNQPSTVVGYSAGDFLPFKDQWLRGRSGLFHVVGFNSDWAEGQYATSFFNDRTWGAGNPFNPASTDRLGMFLDANTGTLILTLKSWGNAQFTADLHAANGVLTGVIHGRQLVTVVLSVSKYIKPDIR